MTRYSYYSHDIDLEHPVGMSTDGIDNIYLLCQLMNPGLTAFIGETRLLIITQSNHELRNAFQFNTGMMPATNRPNLFRAPYYNKSIYHITQDGPGDIAIFKFSTDCTNPECLFLGLRNTPVTASNESGFYEVKHDSASLFTLVVITSPTFDSVEPAVTVSDFSSVWNTDLANDLMNANIKDTPV